ncbi:hypothetical protein J6G99_07515 [bacterium]|nr:hypothetical protein [bacterium]
MRTDCISNTDFKGKLVIVNELSNKPKKCVQKVQNDIQKLVRQKDCNLFIQQDYSKNEMRIVADYSFPLKPNQRTPLFTRMQINIPTTSKASKYVETSKDVIRQFEYNLHQKERQALEQEQKKQKIEEIKGYLLAIVLIPIYIVEEAISGMLHEINPKWANKFEKLLGKIGI